MEAFSRAVYYYFVHVTSDSRYVVGFDFNRILMVNASHRVWTDG